MKIDKPFVVYAEVLHTKEELIEQGHEYDADENNDDFEEFTSVVGFDKYEKDVTALQAEIKRLEMELGQKHYK